MENIFRHRQGCLGRASRHGSRVPAADATVTGLSSRFRAMFAYNYMVTSIRMITQELDGFASELSTALEHKYVDNARWPKKSAGAARLAGAVRLAAPGKDRR